MVAKSRIVSNALACARVAASIAVFVLPGVACKGGPCAGDIPAAGCSPNEPPADGGGRDARRDVDADMFLPGDFLSAEPDVLDMVADFQRCVFSRVRHADGTRVDVSAHPDLRLRVADETIARAVPPGSVGCGDIPAVRGLRTGMTTAELVLPSPAGDLHYSVIIRVRSAPVRAHILGSGRVATIGRGATAVWPESAVSFRYSLADGGVAAPGQPSGPVLLASDSPALRVVPRSFGWSLVGESVGEATVRVVADWATTLTSESVHVSVVDGGRFVRLAAIEMRSAEDALVSVARPGDCFFVRLIGAFASPDYQRPLHGADGARWTFGESHVERRGTEDRDEFCATTSGDVVFRGCVAAECVVSGLPVLQPGEVITRASLRVEDDDLRAEGDDRLCIPFRVDVETSHGAREVTRSVALHSWVRVEGADWTREVDSDGAPSFDSLGRGCFSMTPWSVRPRDRVVHVELGARFGAAAAVETFDVRF